MHFKSLESAHPSNSCPSLRHGGLWENMAKLRPVRSRKAESGCKRRSRLQTLTHEKSALRT